MCSQMLQEATNITVKRACPSLGRSAQFPFSFVRDKGNKRHNSLDG